MPDDQDLRTFALVAQRLGFLDAAQQQRLAALHGQADFAARLLTEVGLSPDQVWAVYRSLERIPCPSCSRWSRIAGAIPGGRHPCEHCGTPLRISTRLGPLVNPVGERMGMWQIVALVGSGGRGHVFRAVHVRDRTTCALKLLDRQLTSRPEYIQRFVREAKVMQTMRHPNVVGIVEVGDQNGVHFLVMELLDGESVTQRIQRRQRLDLPTAIDLARQAGDGLVALHTKGLVHRDLKPDNIMAVGERYVLIDFGLTKGFDSTDSMNMTLTKTGMVVGTPMYMAPEQCSGRPVDARADLYSLGLILHASLTGKAPYPATEAAALMHHQITTPLEPLPAELCPPQLARLIERLTAKHPDDRFPSAAAMLGELAGIARDLGHAVPARSPGGALATSPTLEQPHPTPQHANPLPSRVRWLVAMAAVIALAGAIYALSR